MGLTLAERRAVTETTAVRYQLASKGGTAQLFTLATTKASATAQPQINKRARLREATNASTRAS
ncbi:hypothetical protein MTY414_01530 [Mycolicibacterium mageritense]|nr:hypothetical protein MTY414_01530 [Mycolicibacterium mageritense]